MAATSTLLLGLAVTAAAAPPSCADGGVCVLGDVGPGGGTVFFVKDVGAFSESLSIPDTSFMCIEMQFCRDTLIVVALTAPEQEALPFEYLEVAPASAQVDRIWSWDMTDQPGTSATALGTGASNTAAFIAALPGESPDHAAALYADAFANDERTDWFLPSIDELSLIVLEARTHGTQMGSLTGTTGYLWSSTQESNGSARNRSSTPGRDGSFNKNAAAIGVRPVRSFSALPPATTTTSTSTSTSTTSTSTTPTAPLPDLVTPQPAAPTTVPLAPPVEPPPPVRPPTVGGGSSAVLISGDGAAVDVALPPSAPRGGLAAYAAIDADRSIVVGPTGTVWSTDPADRHGQLNRPLNHPIVGIQLQFASETGPDGPAVSGYWLVASDGGVFTFGSASFHGSTGSRKLNAPVVGLAATPGGGGYWLLGADGGVFSFGDAKFRGSLGDAGSVQPAVALAATPSGLGYWLVGAGGKVTGFGDAGFHGSSPTGSKVVGAAASSTGGGYWLVAADGTVTGYGDVAG